MGFLDKVKNMFVEEYDDDEIKKEVIQVKIPTPERKQEESKIDEIEKDEIKEENEVKEEMITSSIEKKETSSLPKYFDDSDFEMLEERKEPEIVKQEYKYTRTETVISPSLSGYGSKKEENKKSFTPTPIISPVYGVLDKNYRKEEISSKKRPTTIYSQFDKVDVDDIRKKAYGTLEDELESNLSSRDAIIFNDDIDAKIEDDIEISDYEEQPLDIFKELEKKDALDDLLGSYEINFDYEEESSKETSLIEDELNRNYEQYEEDLEASYKEELNDSDLFNLIDSMYAKGEEE